MNYENKRLYIDVAQWGAPTRYVKLNMDLLLMIWANYSLSNLELCIFLYICMQYDNAHESNRQPIKMSYSDIAEIVKASNIGVKKAVKNLLEYKLLKIIGERKGRAKMQYLPDVENIHKMLKEYVTRS